MGADRRPRLRPSPPPLEVDLWLIMAVGTAGWVVALVVCGVLALRGQPSAAAAATCAAGIAIGLYGMRWARRHQGPRPAPATDPAASPTA
jgi:uncharacterized membrane protein YjjB (DUF3815 family)